MVEDSDSHDEEEAREKKESDPVYPPPPPPGLGAPPPPPGDIQPPPPPPGFPELTKDDESVSTEDSQIIDHEAARRMLLGLEEPDEKMDLEEVSEGVILQESGETENPDDNVEDLFEEHKTSPPPGFSEGPEEEVEQSPPPSSSDGVRSSSPAAGFLRRARGRGGTIALNSR